MGVGALIGSISAGIASSIQSWFHMNEKADEVEEQLKICRYDKIRYEVFVQEVQSIKADLKIKQEFQKHVLEVVKTMANRTDRLEKSTNWGTELIRFVIARLDTIELPMRHFLAKRGIKVVTADFNYLFPNVTLDTDSAINFWNFHDWEYQLIPKTTMTLILKIVIPHIKPNLDILEADPFDIYRRKETKLCKYRYHGPRYRYQALEVYEPDSCGGLTTGGMGLWKQDECRSMVANKPEATRIIQTKMDDDYHYVYCFNQTLSTARDTNRFKNVAYRLPITQGFVINHEHYVELKQCWTKLNWSVTNIATDLANAELFPTSNGYNRSFKLLDGLLEHESDIMDRIGSTHIKVVTKFSIITTCAMLIFGIVA
ncbi:hypothetical protein BLOT_016033, partial [Blomia tropicalis]